ncbi:MAG: hypothetical protein ABI718_03940 [Acidobacteriota bacterium]
MQSFDEAGTRLSWIHPDPTLRQFTLRSSAGDDMATLQWQKSEGSLATAETSNSNWTLKRTGFQRPHITARVAGQSVDAATFELGMGGAGTVRLQSGYVFRWSSNLWRSEWSWQNASGADAIVMRREFAMTRREGVVEIVPDAIPPREVPLLVVLGWYIVILLAEDPAVGYAITHPS